MSFFPSIPGIPWNAAFGAKVSAAAVALGVGATLTLGSAEASGDAWCDSASSTGGVDGVITDVLEAPDGQIVQIGTGPGGGSVTVTFDDNIVFDGAGADIRIHTFDAAFPAIATIEVSADGTTFVSAGDFSDDAGDIDLDLDTLGLTFASAVRITHVSGELPGFDLDAITALNQVDVDIAFTPVTNSSPGFTDHTVTAMLTSATSAEGVPVSFEVTAGGPNAGATATANSDATGAADFTWTGENGPGLDVVEAWFDLNQNGVRDDGEPFAAALQQWHSVTGTIEIEDLDGGGLVVGDTVQVTVDDRDLDQTDAPDTVDVLVTSDSDGTGFTLTLTETGDHTGVFVALFELGDVTDELGAVPAAVEGDAVAATYDDELDDNGDNLEPISVGLPVVGIEENEDAGAKVTVCHLPGGNPGNQQTLNIGASALDAHLAHGDSEGECGETDILTKQEQAQEAKAERDAEHAEAAEQRDADHAEASDERAEAAEQRELERAEAAEQRDADFCADKPDHQRCTIED